MAVQRLGIIMNGVTGRMGTNQHLVRSIVAIRKEGGVALKNGDRVMPDPVLVGRNPGKLSALADAHGIKRTSTNLDAALADPDDTVFFDAATTQARPTLLAKAIDAGKHIYCEKPVATNLEEAVAIVRKAKAAGIKHGVVQDKLFLPGLRKLKLLIDSGFFGRILSVRGEFGYWVFEGDLQPTQRPSWNYRAEDGGGIILDMLCHWRYVLDNTFGNVKSVSCLGATHIPERIDEDGKPYKATTDDAAYATFQLDGNIIAHMNSSWCTRVRRDDLLDLARRRHTRLGRGRPAGRRHPAAHGDPEAGLEPRREADHRLLRRLAAGAGHASLRQRLQAAVGGLHPPRRGRRALQVGPARRRQGRAAGGMRAAQLEGAPLDRRAGVESLICRLGRA